MSDRIESLYELLGKHPDDSLARYMIATELYKAGKFQASVEEMQKYLKMEKDEGAAYRILADALVELGRKDEARLALQQGIKAAKAHHHEELSIELEQRLLGL